MADDELFPIRNVGDLRALIDGQGDDVPVRIHFGWDLAIVESGFDDDDGAIILFPDPDDGASVVSTQWLRSVIDEDGRPIGGNASGGEQ